MRNLHGALRYQALASNRAGANNRVVSGFDETSHMLLQALAVCFVTVPAFERHRRIDFQLTRTHNARATENAAADVRTDFLVAFWIGANKPTLVDRKNIQMHDDESNDPEFYRISVLEAAA